MINKEEQVVRTKKVYFADFETTTAKYSETHSKVYLWGITHNKGLNKRAKVKVGVCLNSFFAELQTKKQMTIYFHNLKFDGEFIMHWLLENGFKPSYKPEGTDMKDWELPKGCFSTLMNSMGQMFQIELHFKNGTKIKFKDSFKLFPMSIARINAMVSKMTGLDFHKGSIDYDKYNHFNSVEEVPKEVLKYLKSDLQGIPILYNMFENEIRELTGKFKQTMTLGASVLNIYKSHFNDKAVEYVKGHKRKYNGEVEQKKGKKDFNFYFNHMTNSLDNELRDAYRGGLVMINPNYQDRVITQEEIAEKGHKCLTYNDINSSYPFQMQKKRMPYGKPTRISFDEDFKENPLRRYIYKIAIFRADKRPNMKYMPNHLWKNGVKSKLTAKFIEDNNDWQWGEEYLLTDVELKEVELTYDMDYAIHTIWEFKADYLFEELIETFANKKIHYAEKGIGVLKEVYKLFINNGYGKYGQNPQIISKEFRHTNELTDLDFTYSNTLQYGTGEYKVVRAESVKEEDLAYLPVAIFTTAEARCHLLRGIRGNVVDSKGNPTDRFIYCDTDSITIIGEPDGLDMHPTRLGAWGTEYRVNKFKVIKPKTYIMNAIEEDGEKCDKLIKKVAGFPHASRDMITWDNFNKGHTYEKAKLQAKKVKGGVILIGSNLSL